jgi:hypothetical protein
MEWRELIIDGYGRVIETLERALVGLSREDLERQPHPDSNPMGWLAWHLTRVQDEHIADLMGEEQLWVSDAWHERFGRPADRGDLGWGHTSEQVAAFRSPDVETLLDYHRVVMERTKSYIAALPDAELDRELNEPWFQPLPTVGVRIVSVLDDSAQHAGQVAYVRGLLMGKGWASP